MVGPHILPRRTLDPQSWHPHRVPARRPSYAPCWPVRLGRGLGHRHRPGKDRSRRHDSTLPARAALFAPTAGAGEGFCL